MRPVDIIREERDILKLLGDNVTSEMYNDHISNYVDIFSKNIQKDKAKIIKFLDELINKPEIQKMESKYLEYM